MGKTIEERAVECMNYVKDYGYGNLYQEIFNHITEAIEEARREERDIRIKYQDIVYKICNILDSHNGKRPGHGVVVDDLVVEIENQFGVNRCSDCGHRISSHIGGSCKVDVDGWPCGCEAKEASDAREES